MNIIHLVSNKSWGGGERYALDLCRASQSDGHSVAVVTRGSQAVDSVFAEADFTPGHLPLRGALDMLSPMVLARVLNRMDAPIIIHCHNFKDAYTATRARRLMRQPENARVVVTRHLVKEARNSVMERELYRSIDAMVFVSEAAKTRFLEGKPGCDPARLHVVHNSIVAPEPLGQPKPDGPVNILFVGRLAPEKGVGLLLDAFAKISHLPVKLLIAGQGRGKDVQPLMFKTKALGIDSQVEWLGHVPDIYKEIGRAHIGVLPTLVPEAFGLVVLEFMSQGVPVVASAAGGPKEIITDGYDGYLFDPGNAGDLAEKLVKLVFDKSLREKMGVSAYRKFQSDFTYPVFYGKMAAIYNSLFA